MEIAGSATLAGVVSVNGATNTGYGGGGGTNQFPGSVGTVYMRILPPGTVLMIR
jgi:hypothetical protein